MNRHVPRPCPSLHSVHPKLLFLHSSPCHNMTPPSPQLPKPITCRGSGLPSRLNYLSSIAKSHWLYLQICPEILHLIRPTPSYRLIWSSGSCFCSPCAPIRVHHSRTASVTFQRCHCPTSNPQRPFHLPPNKTQIPTRPQHIPASFCLCNFLFRLSPAPLTLLLPYMSSCCSYPNRPTLLFLLSVYGFLSFAQVCKHHLLR